MASMTYEEVYSRFFTKVEAYDLLSERMDIDNVREEFMCNWLHSAIYNPYIRKQFSSIEMDDIESSFEYTLRYSIDDSADKDFILEVLSYGMMFAWVEPKVNSITNIVQTFGTSDEKFYSQAAHLSELRALRDDMDRKVRSLIRDRGYLNNAYLDGKAKSATMRG